MVVLCSLFFVLLLLLVLAIVFVGLVLLDWLGFEHVNLRLLTPCDDRWFRQVALPVALILAPCCLDKRLPGGEVGAGGSESPGLRIPRKRTKMVSLCIEMVSFLPKLGEFMHVYAMDFDG